MGDRQRDWVDVTAYGLPPTNWPRDIPDEGLRRAWTATPIAIMPPAVRGVHPTQYRVGWVAIDRNRAQTRGGRVPVTPVDLQLAALESESGGFGRHVWLHGERDDLLTKIFGPQPTGFRLRADDHPVTVGGLRAGVQSVLAAGDVIDLDPTALSGAEWTIIGDSAGRVHIEVDNPIILATNPPRGLGLQRLVGSAWQPVSTTVAIGLTDINPEGGPPAA